MDFAARFWERTTPEPNTGCLLWTEGTFANGYGTVWYRGRVQGTHRVAWELVNGPIPEGLEVLHHCDVRPCVLAQPDGRGHLFLGTKADNVADKVAKGRQARGERHGLALHPGRRPRGEKQGNAKLKDEQVLDIRERYAFGDISQRQLAVIFGVSQGTIAGIVRRRQWRHL